MSRLLGNKVPWWQKPGVGGPGGAPGGILHVVAVPVNGAVVHLIL